MEISEERTFIENPFDALKVVIPTLIILFIIVMVGMSGNGPPKNPKLPVKTSGGVLLFFIGVEVFILAIVTLAVSFVKKRSIVCDSKGCTISGKNFWGKMAEPENFLWAEVSATDLETAYLGKGGQEVKFSVTVNGKKTRLLRRTWFNRGTFDELKDTVTRATPHLSYASQSSGNVSRRLIDESPQ